MVATVVSGRRTELTVMVCAQVQRAPAFMRGCGSRATRAAVSTLGPVAKSTWVDGIKGYGMVWAKRQSRMGLNIRESSTRIAGGPFGVLTLPNGAVYSGTWANGVQSGEGVETYADGGEVDSRLV